MTIFLHVNGADVGVAFAPMVRKGDLPNDRSYSKEMVKMMLEIILKADYHSVTTWGMGAPNKAFDKSSISESASIVHTPIAAAEINRERKYLALTIYEGLYQSVYEDQVNTEIEIGLKMAKEANEIFPGTVPAIMFPSRVGFNDLIDNTNLNQKFKNVSTRVRAINLKFGVRITDCPQIPTRSYQKVMDVVSQTDFIICMVAPDENRFKFGYENFKNSAILSLLQAEEFLENTVKMNMSSFKLILETGWAGDDALKSPNSVSDLKGFWALITEWAKQSNRQVFLHEAFDSPWKDTISEGAELAAHFGRWKYNESEKNPLNRNAYILKEDAVPSPIATLLAGFSWTQGGILIGIVLLIAIITLMTMLYKRVNRIEFTVISEIDVKAFFDGAKDDGEYVDAIWEKSPYDKSLELAKSQLKIDTTGKGLLGSGQFGFVYKGKLVSSETDVAVKMTRPYSPPIAVKCLLSEIKILTHVGTHDHVCKLLGAFTQEISNGTSGT
ncbi:Mast/stem cell growth factor receptor Kit [Orchesella cincta]|uniref:Mast/stem cell growth factor receptor Kit n=1 Tax=Orchesella cincta TaxID=48709 RepID=A0A1D2MP10_ORCCI|nr:Mast/stem cell growth factor receptor Kit [Orchesella cincta]